MHADVFSRTPWGGSGVVVVRDAEAERLTTEQMLAIAAEMRQPETVFVFGGRDRRSFRTRVFTASQEIPFGALSTLAAAGILHEELVAEPSAEWNLELGTRTVKVETGKREGWVMSVMDLGNVTLGTGLSSSRSAAIVEGLGLSADDLDPRLPVRMGSTGLPVLLVPLEAAIDRAGIVDATFDDLLAAVGARNVIAFDTTTLEVRSWDASGRDDPSAAAAAVGALGGYLVDQGYSEAGKGIVVQLGTWGRAPYRVAVKIERRGAGYGARVGGEVCVVARGSFLEVPSPEPA